MDELTKAKVRAADAYLAASENDCECNLDDDDAPEGDCRWCTENIAAWDELRALVKHQRSLS